MSRARGAVCDWIFGARTDFIHVSFNVHMVPYIGTE